MTSLVLCMALSGCANDQQRTRTEGVAFGAIVGAVLGHAIGGKDGAAAGAAIGGAAGGLAGNQVAEKKLAYAEREDALRAAAQRSHAMAEQARIANAALQKNIAVLEATVSRLQSERMTAQNRSAMARAARRTHTEANNRIEEQLVTIRGEIERQQALLEREKQLARQTQQPTPLTGMQLVSVGLRDLGDNERALERAKAQLALLDSRRAY